MDLEGTPGLIDRRYPTRPVMPARVPSFVLPEAPAFTPKVTLPTVLADLHWTPADDTDEVAPAWMVNAGVIALAGVAAVLLFAWIIPAVHGFTPIWLKALIPAVGLAYFFQRDRMVKFVRGLLGAVQGDLAIRTHHEARG